MIIFYELVKFEYFKVKQITTIKLVYGIIKVNKKNREKNYRKSDIVVNKVKSVHY